MRQKVVNKKNLSLDESVDADDFEDVHIEPKTRRAAATQQESKPNGSARRHESEDIDMD